MNASWQTITIGELCDQGGGSVQTGPFGSQLHAEDYVADGIPFVMPTNLGENRISEDEIARISVADAERLSRYRLKTGDIIYGRRGDIGRRALVTKYQDGWMCGSGCIRIRFGDARVEPRFVSFYLGQSQVKEWILAKAVGSTMPNLNSEIIRSVPVSFPALPIQRRIADILGALDDKIECNRRMNATLEAMAQALYKHWFVDFGPFRNGEFVDSELGEIPQGWSCSQVSEHVNLDKGLSYRSESLQDDGLPFLNLKCVAANGRFRRDGIKYYKGEYKQTHIARSGDIFLAMTDLTQKREVLGSPIIAPKLDDKREMIFSLDLCGVRIQAISPLNSAFLYNLFLTPDFKGFVKGYANGTTVLHLNKDGILNFRFVCPPSSVLVAFDHKVQPMLDIIADNEVENETLIRTRDYLLPKLLSGQVEVKPA